jgi:hypothetical protein
MTISPFLVVALLSSFAVCDFGASDVWVGAGLSGTDRSGINDPGFLLACVPVSVSGTAVEAVDRFRRPNLEPVPPHERADTMSFISSKYE